MNPTIVSRRETKQRHARSTTDLLASWPRKSGRTDASWQYCGQMGLRKRLEGGRNELCLQRDGERDEAIAHGGAMAGAPTRHDRLAQRVRPKGT